MNELLMALEEVVDFVPDLRDIAPGILVFNE
jgi:hypothetical protein